MSRPVPRLRGEYAAFKTLTTRWADNDAYGHLNNVVYYEFFDTAVNQLHIEAGLLDVENSPVIGLVVETQCNYFASLAYPQQVEAAVRVAHLGGSSVRYEIGLFAAGSDAPAAQGHFIHVYVDRATQKPVQIPEPTRRFLESLQR
jgi:acyl-CoA thioester hydrolase